MSPAPQPRLSRDDRTAVVQWLSDNKASLPEPIGRLVAVGLAEFDTPKPLSQKQFDRLARQLALALGLIPSTERRRSSGRPIPPISKSGSSPATREKLERTDARLTRQILRDQDARDTNRQSLDALTEEESSMRDRPYGQAEVDAARERHREANASNAEYQAATAANRDALFARFDDGDGADPAYTHSDEALMNADVVCVDEEQVVVEAELPATVSEDDVVKTLVDDRVRYDFSVTVTKLHLEVEKKVVVTENGERRVYSGSVAEYGPKGFAVTWQAMATLATLIGQFAIPMNRLGTLLSTSTKRFTSTSLGRMSHYVAERFLPIYFVLMDQLADTDIFAGDDTSCRVLEVSRYMAKSADSNSAQEPPPWESFGTAEKTQATYMSCIDMNEDILSRRAEGDREARKQKLHKVPLRVQIARELPFVSSRRDGKGVKKALNTTVVTGRAKPDDPRSQIVFYRSHLGALGNLLEMLLARRRPKLKDVIVQADLATTNLVTDPELNARFNINLVGCTAHARRPFAQYGDHDPLCGPYALSIFGELASHERGLDLHGRNRDNVLAVRQHHSRPLWNELKELAEKMVHMWTKATPLGTAARYIIRHFDRLTAYLDNPRLDATNNLRERLLRTEKLIEKSSMFRQSIEGRAVLDILRTILQTAVAAGVPPHQYLMSVLKSDPVDVAQYPEEYTPAAWAARTGEQASAN